MKTNQNRDAGVSETADASPKLGAALKQRHITMISLGGIIGAGLFVGSSATLSTVGPAACLSYLAAGIVVLLVMRMLGEMALAEPGVGSFTEYARIGMGDWAGFATGWLYWYFWVIVVAVEAVAGAGILQRWIAAPTWVIGLVLLSVMTIVNLLSVKSYGEFEFWFASLKVAAIVVFMVLGLAWIFGTGHQADAWHNLSQGKGFVPFGYVSILAAVPTVIFAVCGAEIATIAAAESNDPAKNVASMTRSVILRVITFYVGSMLLIACIVPWSSVVTGHSPLVAALEAIHVPGAADIMNAIVLTAVLSALNSGLYVSSRILFRLASNGDAPRSFTKLSDARVPRPAVLASSVVGYLVGWPPRKPDTR